MVEKKNGVVPVSKKVAASVLAGIMATGMVPAAAFAEGTATDTSSDSNVELQAEDVESQAADDVEIQSVPKDKAFSAAKVSPFDKDKHPILNKMSDPVELGKLPTEKLSYVEVEISDKKTLKLVYDVDTGKFYDDAEYQATKKKDLNYSISYKNDADVTVNEDTVRNNSGDYKLVINANEGTYKGGAASFGFRVKGTEISVDDKAYNKESNTADDFTYNASSQKIAFKTGGNVLEEDKYTVQYFKEGSDPADPSQALPSTPVDAGKYIAKLTPRDGVTFNVKLIPFTIKKLDLSKIADLGAQFSTSIVVGAETPINSKVQLVSVNGSTALASKLQAIDWIKNPDDPKGKDLGRYKAKLTAKDPADQNFERNAEGIITGESNYVVYRVAHATSMEYDGRPMEGQSVNINRDLGQSWSKSVDFIKARDKDGSTTKPSEILYTNVTTGKRVTTIPDTPGEYIVTALWHYTDPNPDHAKDYEYGAAATMRVTVSDNSVDADTNAIVTFKQQKDGEAVVTNAIKTTYDGTDIIKRIGYSIKTKVDGSHPNGYLNEGPDKDYTVDFTDSKGNIVTSIKDAGTYTLTFKSKKYFIKNPSVPITIEPAKIQAIMPFRNVRLTEDDPEYDKTDPKPQYRVRPITKDSIGNGQSSVVVADGEVFIRYNDGEKNTNGDLVWKDLPADAVVKITNSKGEAVKKFDKADTYKISVSKPSASDTNMEITAPEMTVTATDRVTKDDFLDVINPANYTGSDPLPWYCKEVYKAKELGYIHGYDNDTPPSKDSSRATMFKPEQSITRAEFARVIFNMAGEPDNETVRGLMGKDKSTFRTDFSDCNDSAWYAKAVAWAHAVGIVKGDDGTTNFRPEDQISRQEVAIMLSRYEKFAAPAQYKSGEGTSLSAYLDSFAVDSWAHSAVQWAVANKVMGVNTNLLSPRNDITRAEVAAMAVRAQPNKLAGVK